ncbi:hypothetical protein [Shimia sp. MMG029]|uniref:hypothetical protein n=1 Tax=Shimia sp. MMG029 TaxID=3021978 RepID=UPI0022FE882A|nr:hypothetical protein [Shimia sp. MMG029]MDA5557190.1 hypothetical protein [Shimia sp. MMG029]
MVEAVGILGETTGWQGLSATQNAMLHAALAKYSGQAPQVPVESSKAETVQPVQQAQQTARTANEAQRNRTVDGAVMTAIRSAVASYQRADNGNFAEILKSKLTDAGIDTSKSVVDYYT